MTSLQSQLDAELRRSCGPMRPRQGLPPSVSSWMYPSTFAGPSNDAYSTQSLIFRVGFANPRTRLVFLLLYFLHLQPRRHILRTTSTLHSIFQPHHIFTTTSRWSKTCTNNTANSRPSATHLHHQLMAPPQARHLTQHLSFPTGLGDP